MTEYWEAKAACANKVDPEMFFPNKGQSSREAKKVCKECDVSSECLDAALKRGERFGIWGGMTTRERDRVRLLNNRLLGRAAITR